MLLGDATAFFKKKSILNKNQYISNNENEAYGSKVGSIDVLNNDMDIFILSLAMYENTNLNSFYYLQSNSSSDTEKFNKFLMKNELEVSDNSVGMIKNIDNNAYVVVLVFLLTSELIMLMYYVCYKFKNIAVLKSLGHRTRSIRYYLYKDILKFYESVV
ncbi:MAG: hypothetical protein ACK5KR_00695 [Breznakia sp.]